MATCDTLHCPMCGAAASPDETRCGHCGAALAMVACPSCFGMMFVGAKFCSHCGAKAQRVEAPADPHELCPRCRVEMRAVMVGPTPLEECPQCEGTWVDVESLRRICAEQERQAAVLALPASMTAIDQGQLEQNIRYIPCPVCGELMNRYNFAHCSNVIVDVCRLHGTWFDKDELRRIVEFIRNGGMEKARALEQQRLDEDKRRVREANLQTITEFPGSYSAELGPAHYGISIVWAILRTWLNL